jgi:hypothetical protein
MCEFVTSCRLMSENMEARSLMEVILGDMFLLIFRGSLFGGECVWRVGDGLREFVEGILQCCQRGPRFMSRHSTMALSLLCSSLYPFFCSIVQHPRVIAIRMESETRQ